MSEETAAPTGSAGASADVLPIVNQEGRMLERTPWFPSELDVGAECYRVIGCAGSPLSGKSTLLNELFGTHFSVSRVRATDRRRWSTRGISASLAANQETILVLEVDGGDGGASGQQLQERCLRYICSVSDVVLCNVWYHDLGRYDSDPQWCLRTMVRELSQADGPLLRTCVVFVVRDADGDALDSTAAVTDALWLDAEEYWQQETGGSGSSSTSSSGAAATSSRSVETLRAALELRVVLLPSPRASRSAYDTAVQRLRHEMLDAGGSLSSEFSKGLPADGFAAFSRRLWEGIAAQPAGWSRGSVPLALHMASVDRGAFALASGGNGALPSEALVAAYHCDGAFSEILRNSAEELGELASQLEEGDKISGFGRRAEDLLNKYLSGFESATEAYAGQEVRERKRAELESVLDASLQSLFLKQLQLIRENALQHFKTASSSEEIPGDFAFYTADALFQREAEDSVRPGSDWSYANERSDLQQTMAEISARRKQLIHVQIQAAEQQRQAMQYMQLQQAQLQAIQQQQYGGTLGNWNVGVAYRPPDTNVNLSLLHQQGRTQVQVSMVPDEQAGLLGPNGFTSGVGPGNLGVSFNINI
ncbi:hypothetical protein F1559_002956 [Cyanidiococcus yangmingshanensis]|uniref:Sey1/RHD3-like three-helix bundle domain-containing protein n=1 Tax=Cyanidiococcus yangmingshanensis TaxID=2690220 RepID=A0A7J7II87_9RHOD|nr:hypothetical protein F1559_002956 [Cyanidiococcus yangmingshanensis]